MQVLSRHRRMFSYPGPPVPVPAPAAPDTNRILIAIRSGYKLRLKEDHTFNALSRAINDELVRRKVIRRGTDAVSISDDKVVITTVARMDVEFMLWAITEAEALYRDGWRVTGFARDPSDGSLL